MPLPEIFLSENQRSEINHTIGWYLKNKKPGSTTIFTENNRPLHAFSSLKFDKRLFYTDELNILGIFLADNKGRIPNTFDRIIQLIKTDLQKKNAVPQIYNADSLARELDASVQEIRACLKLIGHFPLFVDRDSGCKDNEFGFSFIEIASEATFHRYLSYKSLDKFISDMLDYRYPKISDPPKIPVYSRPISKIELSEILGLSAGLMSKKGNAWKKLFDEGQSEGRYFKLRLDTLLNLTRAAYSRKKWKNPPKTINEMQDKIK
jgi:hypothetical protein